MTTVMADTQGEGSAPVQGIAGGSPRRSDSTPGALLRLLLVVAGGFALAVVFHGVSVLIVVLALVIMVMVHEGGHFVAAKLSGMKVTEYFLGFGPRIWSFRRGETDYGVKAIPAGGYVRVVGMTMLEEVDPVDEARSYRQSSFPRRMAVAVAGSAMHFVMAFLLLWGLEAFAGLPVAAVPQVTALTQFASGQSPAQLAGMRPGDEIVSIDGHQFSQYDQYVTFIQDHLGATLAVVVRRGSKDLTLHVRPVNGQHVKIVEDGKVYSAESGSASKPIGFIGVDLQYLTRNETVNPLVAVGRATTMLGSVTSQTASGIAQVFSLHGLNNFVHQVRTAGVTTSSSAGSGSTTSSASSSSSSSNSGQIISIIGAIEVGSQALRQNVSELLYILVAINIFVGMINLFPMLPLDGGHVVIAVYERIRSRRGRSYHADVTKLMPVAYALLLFMVVLGVGALYANIVQPVSLPGG